MNAKRRKQCGDKFRWPSMETAKHECWRKWRRGIWIQAYRCKHCGGIHVGHFRQDELPEVETTMSKTRVYAVFCNERREGGIHLDRADAEEERAYFAAARWTLREKDINEEEYARIAMDYMEQDAARKAWERGYLPEGYAPPDEPSRTLAPDDWMSLEGWTDCSERPEPPRRNDAPSPRSAGSNQKRGSR
jgi:hypothetical protein